jgi:predicted ribosomally synthesized peptide with nif11-like leader
MSAASEIERFAKDVKTNEAFRAEIEGLGTDQDAILRLANAKGYDFTMADVDALGGSVELTDEQLGAVAGGLVILYSDGTTTVSGSGGSMVYTSGKKSLVWFL